MSNNKADSYEVWLDGAQALDEADKETALRYARRKAKTTATVWLIHRTTKSRRQVKSWTAGKERDA